MKKSIVGIAAACIGAGLIILVLLHEEMVSLPDQLTSEQVAEEIKALKKQREASEAHLANEEIDYSLANNQLHVTLNHGSDWIEVPVHPNSLFFGEGDARKGELQQGTYWMNEHRIAFLFHKPISLGEDGYSTAAETKLLYTSDQGETWEQSTVFEQMLPPRFQKLAFVTGSFGYIVLTSDKTMSSELTHLAITEDGGSSWKTTRTPDTHRLVADGGFVDEQLGFLSYGILTTDEPDLYVTTDGGTNWESATFTMPEAYQIHFVVAETPFYEEGELLVYVRQGSDGDWNGGQSKGLFHSEDQGRTWEFVREVMPDEFD